MLNIRLEDEHYAKVEADAAEEGQSLSNYVRLRLGLPPSRYSSKRTVLLEEPPLTLVADPVILAAKKAGKRTGICVHRVAPESFCRRCD